MKILHIVDQFDYCDGCARHVFFLAKNQKRKGDTVSVIAGKGDAVRLLEQEGIPYHVIPFVEHAGRSVGNFFLGAVKLRRFIQSFEPDVIHAHHYYAGHIVRMASFFREHNLVFTIHANFPDAGVLSKYVGNAMIAVSESTKARAIRKNKSFENKLAVVPNSSDFLGLESEVRSMSQFKLLEEKKSNAFVIAVAGRLVRVKGVHILLSAVAALQAEFPVVCVIAGTGEEERELKALAVSLSVETVFLGMVHDTKPILEISDVVVIPSLSGEGLPMTLLEAGLVGKAVVASKTDGIPEVITDDVTGLLVSPGDIDQLTRALRRLHHDVELRRRLGSVLFERVRTNSVEIMAERVEEIYRTVVSVK